MTAVTAMARGFAFAAVALAVAACAGSRQENQPTSAAAPQEPKIALRPGPGGDMQPDQLLGLSGDQLTGLLGPADFTRNDGPAEIWQFRNSGCVLDVFLYQDLRQGGYRVEHVETRDRGLVREAERACVADLLRARRTRPEAG